MVFLLSIHFGHFCVVFPIRVGNVIVDIFTCIYHTDIDVGELKWEFFTEKVFTIPVNISEEVFSDVFMWPLRCSDDDVDIAC